MWTYLENQFNGSVVIADKQTAPRPGAILRRELTVALVGLALIVSACGSPTVDSDETTTTSAEATTTTDSTTSTTSRATTTTQATTTTESGSSELAAFMSTLQSGEQVTSGRMEGSIEMTGLDETTAGVSEVTILFSTAFDTVTGNSSFLMDMSSMAGAIQTEEDDPFAGMAEAFLGEMEFRQVGDRVYLKFPLFTSMFGAETEWVSMPAEEGDDFTSSFETMPSDPNEVLEAYEGAEATIEDLGSETVNGVQATHYRISLNTEAMDLTDAERAELEASGLFANGVIPMDIWVSDAGYMVRLLMEIDGSGIDAPPEEQFEKMTLRYDMVDINGDVVIEAPPASEVTDMEDLEGSFFQPEG